MKSGRPIPPPVVCRTESGKLYLRDGNHRYLAMREFLGDDPRARVRVAMVLPRAGFHFRYRWFGTYATYLLEPTGRVPVPVKSRKTRSTQSAALFPGRFLVLVAHPDDETAAAGLIQRLRDPVIVYASDGAPSDPFFWRKHGSRHNYSVIRRSEALAALRVIGTRQTEFLKKPHGADMHFADQELHLSLSSLLHVVSELLERYRPDTLLVPAYEGGHPDHDSCSFVGNMLGRRFDLPVWEMPLYHRSDDGRLVCRSFRALNGTEISIQLNSSELQKRDLMIASYRSQQDLHRFLTSPGECYRPQPAYDYEAPPHNGFVNYQAWGWPISPTELCRCFRACLAQERPPRTITPNWSLLPGDASRTIEVGLQ